MEALRTLSWEIVCAGLVVSALITALVGVCILIWPRKRRPDGGWDLEPTQSVERRYREAQGHE